MSYVNFIFFYIIYKILHNIAMLFLSVRGDLDTYLNVFIYARKYIKD